MNDDTGRGKRSAKGKQDGKSALKGKDARREKDRKDHPDGPDKGAKRTGEPLVALPPPAGSVPPAISSPLFAEGHPAADLLEMARTHWQCAAWAQLVALDRDGLDRHPDRAKLALLAAAGHMQVGAIQAARRCLARALDWGVDRGLAARVAAASVHATLGRIAFLLEDEAAAENHCRASLGLVEPRADVGLLARMRAIRERARLGLLPDAVRLLGAEVEAARADPAANDARYAMLAAEVELLANELRLAVTRGQLYQAAAPVLSAAAPAAGKTMPQAPPGLAARAVSQLGQELWVLERTGYKRGGYFVDFGATDGVMLSNTWLLETEFDWTGICAEPNPGYLEALRRNRRCIVTDACIGAETGAEVTFVLAGVYGTIADYADEDSHAEKRAAYRTAGRTLQLTTVSLEDLLIAHDAPREIDYLSIDTEGSEYDILRAFPFDRWRIRLITVEHNFTAHRDAIRALLEARGYARTEARWDDWYELPEG